MFSKVKKRFEEVILRRRQASACGAPTYPANVRHIAQHIGKAKENCMSCTLLRRSAVLSYAKEKELRSDLDYVNKKFKKDVAHVRGHWLRREQDSNLRGRSH